MLCKGLGMAFSCLYAIGLSLNLIYFIMIMCHFC